VRRDVNHSCGGHLLCVVVVVQFNHPVGVGGFVNLNRVSRTAITFAVVGVPALEVVHVRVGGGGGGEGGVKRCFIRKDDDVLTIRQKVKRERR
jgi:hypothetical protein